MKERVYKYIEIIIIIVISNALAILSGFWGWDIQISIVGIVYTIMGFLYFRSPFTIIIYFVMALAPFVIIYDIGVFINGLVHVYPIAIVPIPSFLFGVILRVIYSKHKIWFYLLIIVFLVFMGLLSTVFMPNYLSYVFSTKERQIEESKVSFPKVNFTDINEEKVDLKQFENKIIVLDFWSTSCGVCFKCFPDFQDLINRYKNNSMVVFFAVAKVNPHQNVEDVRIRTKNLPYDFLYLFVDNDSINQLFTSKYVQRVPTIIIIDKGGSIMFIDGGSIVYNRHVYRNVGRKLDEILAEY